MKETQERLIALETLLIKKGIITDDELEKANEIWKEIELEKEEHP